MKAILPIAALVAFAVLVSFANAHTPNNPPTIAGLPDQTVTVGQSIPLLDLFVYASDTEDYNTDLVFSIDSQSDQSVISCVVTGNDYLQCGPAQKAGFSDVTVKVTDTDGLSDTDTFRITVQAPANTPPVISGIPDLTISIGQTISLVDLFAYASDAEDPDSSLSFSIDSQSDQSVISCYITGNRYVGCGSAQKAGFSDIIVMVTDTEGLSDTDTFRITVEGQPPAGDHAPLIDSLSITPSSPEDTDMLTCTAHVSDEDGNLERVQFKWFVDGGLDRTRTIYVSGSSSSVQDTLDSGRSGIGDEVKCEATVYDTTELQDTDFDTVVIQRQECGVDVSNLEVTASNNIRFQVRNTGASTQTVRYDLYVDGGLIQESTITLNPGEVEIVQKSYSFGIGSFVVKAKATAQCGAMDSESITHDVLNPCPSPSECQEHQDENPRVDSVRITPSDPEEGDDLTCRVEVSDNDGDLDKVRLKWFIEGDLEKTRTIFVSGSSDDVQDTLNSGWFGRGRDVMCEATVFDRDGNEDTDSDTVTIGGEHEEGCGVDVYSLELIEDNVIRFRIRNTGDRTEDITYKIYLESNVFDQHTITLDDGESRSVEESFTFDVTDFVVKVKATADCGATDSEFLFEKNHGACIAKYLDDYMCNGNWIQRRYQYNDCSTNWMNFQYCYSGCSNGCCSGTGGSCGVSIQRFEYQTSVVAGNAAYVTVEAKNTANRQETITLSLWVDGQLKESFPSSVAPNAVTLRTFYYYPSAGTHQILAKAETSCGSSDTRTATVTAFQSGQPTPYPYPQPQPPAPSLPTAVSIYPSSLDTSLCGARFVTIDIHNSVEQIYTIQVTGISADWVSYQSQNVVAQGDRQLFVYVGPKEPGAYNMRVTVTAGTEGKSYQQDVSVYTAACPQQATGTGWSITGSLIEVSQNPLFWIVLIIIAGAVIIFIGAARLEPDEEFYEPAYPYRRFKPVEESKK